MTQSIKVKAAYRVDSVDSDLIRITDLNSGRSVTNDAEAVVAELTARYGVKRIYYVDSCGNVDELLHTQGVFKGFAPGPAELNPQRLRARA